MLRPQLEPHFSPTASVCKKSDSRTKQRGALVARTRSWVADSALWDALRRAAATPSAAESSTPDLLEEHSRSVILFEREASSAVY